MLAGLRWPAPGSPRVLCLHGWLDNAASFIPLSGLLAGLDLVAVDLPGHGRSDYRHSSSNYYFTDYLFDVDAALDALGWDSCHLLGHSMGAAISSLFAVAAPERVRSLIMLDALGIVTTSPEKTATRLRKSIRSVRAGGRRRKPYASIEDMIKARQANSELGDEAVRLITERSVKQTASHYEWSNDPKLYWDSPVLMTEEQALDCLRKIEVPALSLTATPFSRFISEEQLRTRSAAIPHGQHELLEGNHHFHMDQPEKVAALVHPFILEHDQKFSHSRKQP